MTRGETAMPSIEPPILVTVKEAQRLTGLGRTRLYELMNDGTLESVLIPPRKRQVVHLSILALGQRTPPNARHRGPKF
jgi:adenine C2-methylase RlmN of 23S rRNA A2503 and tRNA A37